MSFVEDSIGILLSSFFYLLYINQVLLILFLATLIFFIILRNIHVRNSTFFPNVISTLIKKITYQNQKKSVESRMGHYGELSKRQRVLPVLIPLLITIVIAYIVLNHYVFLAIVTSGSMSPALEVKDLVLIQNLHVNPQQGDIVMFNTKKARMPVIHRVHSVSGDVIKTKGDAVAFPDDWTLKKETIQGEAILFKGEPIIVKNIGEYLLFDSDKVQITKYGSEMHRVSQILKNVKKLGFTIFIICILLYIFLAASSKH
ncbi:MAG: hypothetical protein AEth_01372 [Candidatus Argoarchaeum ethanivorans]|uniref:Peptidase S26 domain-containing protein n=1 Tax=Candidatus Argoarchaeum ethanivorans TaxID=2608793 RepID=A0A8B3S1P4_9EURY|nr:MAG: hypothetical protein AEth_01372 [Candidatus Argoarchaeum ethanivorans]